MYPYSWRIRIRHNHLFYVHKDANLSSLARIPIYMARTHLSDVCVVSVCDCAKHATLHFYTFSQKPFKVRLVLGAFPLRTFLIYQTAVCVWADARHLRSQQVYYGCEGVCVCACVRLYDIFTVANKFAAVHLRFLKYMEKGLDVYTEI